MRWSKRPIPGHESTIRQSEHGVCEESHTRSVAFFTLRVCDSSHLRPRSRLVYRAPERLRRIPAEGPEPQAACRFDRLYQDAKTELLVEGQILRLGSVRAARQAGGVGL